MADSGTDMAPGARADSARSDRRQIGFEPLQTHTRSFELTMIALSIICIIVVLFIILATNIGNEFRPTA